jgi:hypothetical protein
MGPLDRQFQQSHFCSTTRIKRVSYGGEALLSVAVY